MIGNPQKKIAKFVTRVRISWEQTSLLDLYLPKYNESLAEILGQQTRHIGISTKSHHMPDLEIYNSQTNQNNIGYENCVQNRDEQQFSKRESYNLFH